MNLLSWKKELTYSRGIQLVQLHIIPVTLLSQHPIILYVSHFWISTDEWRKRTIIFPFCPYIQVTINYFLIPLTLPYHRWNLKLCYIGTNWSKQIDRVEESNKKIAPIRCGFEWKLSVERKNESWVWFLCNLQSCRCHNWSVLFLFQ